MWNEDNNLHKTVHGNSMQKTINTEKEIAFKDFRTPHEQHVIIMAERDHTHPAMKTKTIGNAHF